VDHFTPVSALIGGALIGLAAALLWVGNGRIAGISGIVGALTTSQPPEIAWRIAFLAGLIAAPLLYRAGGGILPQLSQTGSAGVIVVGGLLVGIGTRLGGGCTSGHGVCGMARLSPRSLAATGIFMAAAVITVFVTRHLAGI
jgi:hypothetical protein